MSPNPDYPPPSTLRPSTDLVVALESLDPGRAFLERMRGLLAPGLWQTETEHGFWWIPYQLCHTVEVFDVGDTLVCRSDFVLVDSITDTDLAAHLCAIFNQRSFGGAVWLDEESATIHVSSSVHLGPGTWFNAHIFENTVTRLVGLCEVLAPRLAAAVGGRVAAVSHPQLGPRTEPDLFVVQHLQPTFQPEASTGLWWSRVEVAAFRRAMQFFLRDTDQAELIDPTDYDDDVTSALNLELEYQGRWGEAPMRFRVHEADHPDLGYGLEFLVVTPVRVDGAADPPHPPNDPTLAVLAANAVNMMAFHGCPAPLWIGGWTTYRGQFCHSTFVMGEVAHMLQDLSGTRVGQVFAVLASQMEEVVRPLGFAVSEHDLFGVACSVEERSLWGGVSENATHISLLGDDDDVTSRLIERLPLNTPLQPVELDADVWPLQHSNVIACMGIFNPAGPTVGTFEVIINHTFGRALLVERMRHPLSPSMRLYAVMDRDGFGELARFVEEAIAALYWDGVDWFNLRFPWDGVAGAVERGLVRFAQGRDSDFGHRADALIQSSDTPWRRLDSGFPTLRTPGDNGPADIDRWVQAVTDARNIDSHVAYLRSAWEGAQSWARNGDAAAAQHLANVLMAGVVTRQRGDG